LTPVPLVVGGERELVETSTSPRARVVGVDVVVVGCAPVVVLVVDAPMVVPVPWLVVVVGFDRGVGDETICGAPGRALDPSSTSPRPVLVGVGWVAAGVALPAWGCEGLPVLVLLDEVGCDLVSVVGEEGFDAAGVGTMTVFLPPPTSISSTGGLRRHVLMM
jgi:hypothetical protein